MNLERSGRIGSDAGFGVQERRGRSHWGTGNETMAREEPGD
jgi:hypothetical protein